MATTQDITEGIKVIKVNKTDIDGLDNTLSLQELEILRLKLASGEVAEFNVLSIRESVDYYTFFVEPIDIIPQSVSAFINPSSIVEGLISGGKYVLTPPGPNYATISNYSIGSVTSCSLETGGYIKMKYPSKVDVQVDVVFSQSAGPDTNPLYVYLTGSGIYEISDRVATLESLNTWETRSVTIPIDISLINSDSETEEFRVGFVSALTVSNVIAINTTQTKVYVSQSSWGFTDNNLFDATLDATANGTRTLGASNAPTSMSTWDFVGGTYYDFPGVNTLGNLDVTCSFQAHSDFGSGFGNGQLQIDFVSDQRGTVVTETFSLVSQPNFTGAPYVYFSHSFYPLYVDEQFYIQVSNPAGGGNEDARIRSGSWEINQTQPAQSPVNLNVLEPYLTENFSINDCNPLINNTLNDRINEFYMDVDYTSNSITAVNSDQILSGSATRARVQYSNYTSERVTRPRYEGSRNTADDYNVDDGAIDATQAYFAYFNWVGGTSPEWGNGLEDRSGVNLKWLIDGNGRVIKPINDSQGINIGILRQNFIEDQISTLAFDDETGTSAAFTNLVGNQTVFKSGKSITPIIYSQIESIASGSSGNWTGSLSFVQGDQQQSSVGDYRLTAFNQGDTIVTTGKVDYQNVTVQGAKATWTSDDTYSPQTTSPSSENVTLTFVGTLKRVGGPVNKTVTVRFYKNGSAVGTSAQFDFSNPFYNSLDITYQDATATTSDTYDLRITTLSGTGILELSTDSYIQVSQTPVPSIGNANSPFFESTLNADIIRTTTGFSAFYGQKQEDINGSGFFTIVNDFEILPGDEIRFEGTETQAYYIKDVYAGSGGKIHLLLDRDCTASNLNWFLVRRYVDDAANIILAVDKPPGGTAPGVLKPQYLSRNVELNLDNILEDLKDKQLI